jgi:hypothetical protein
MAEQVEGPDGRSWAVMRRWVPRLPGETLWGRFRRRFGRSSRRMRDWDGVADVADLASSGGGDGIAGVLAMIGLAIAAVLLVVLVLPLLLALVEVMILALLALVAVGARILLRRPWTVEAVADDGALRTWRIVGWRNSGEHVRRVADQIRTGEWSPHDREGPRTSDHGRPDA